jgi:uncharacterized membrane protein YGL010W
VRVGTVATAAAVAGLSLLAVLTAVVEAFLVPVELVPGLSVATLLAVAANLALTRAAWAATGRGALAVVPALAWLVTAFGLGFERAEGDLVVPGTGSGLLFLLAGTVAAAVGAGYRPRPRSRGPRPPGDDPDNTPLDGHDDGSRPAGTASA